MSRVWNILIKCMCVCACALEDYSRRCEGKLLDRVFEGIMYIVVMDACVIYREKSTTSVQPRVDY